MLEDFKREKQNAEKSQFLGGKATPQRAAGNLEPDKCV